MGRARTGGTERLRRGGAAAVAAGLIMTAAVAGRVGPASAAPRVQTATAGDISTIAGGPGGPARATNVSLTRPCGAAFGGGALYVGDSWDVRRIDPSSDQLTTPAGTGFTSPIGTGGPAHSAGLSNACTVAVDHHGDLVIVSGGSHLLEVMARHTGRFYQRAMTAGDIYTVTGGGHYQYSGVPVAKFQLINPSGVAVDSAGNLLVADTSRVWVVAEATGTFYGRAMRAGRVYPLAGNGFLGYSGDGGRATRAEINFARGLALDPAGDVVIADSDNHCVRLVAEHTGTFYGQPMTAGNIYTVAGDGTSGFAGDGGPATGAELSYVGGVSADASGNLLIADSGNSRVRVVAASTGMFYGQPMTAGNIYTVAGDGTAGYAGDRGPATSAEINLPDAVSTDGAGNLVIADSGNTRVRVVAASTGMFYGQPMTAGDIYTIAGNQGLPSVNGGPATSAQFSAPDGVTADGSGDVAVADPNDQRVLLLAGHTGTIYGRTMTAGHLYTMAGDGTAGYAGDGGSATKAQLNDPHGVAVDAAGNLVIADTDNNRVRVVAAGTGMYYGQPMIAGHIYTVAGDGTAGYAGDGGPATSAKISAPLDVVMDAAGNLVLSDTSNNRIRVVAEHTGTFYGQPMTAGDIYTVAGNGTFGYAGDGGPAISAEISHPWDLAVDPAGNLVIADTDNNRIRVVAEHTGRAYGQPMTAGDIYTVAGNGSEGYLGDGGPATSAEITLAQGVAADHAGNLLIADTGNNVIRVVAGSTGTFYGQPMAAGYIYTVVGNSFAGFAGNGGPATSAELSNPAGITVDSTGDVLFADAANLQIRKIAG
jgi:hypothetical protein